MKKLEREGEKDVLVVTDPLTVTEQGTLARLEQTIETGLSTFLNTFYEVGQALQTIRETRLYRQGYETFEAYCKERWEFVRRQADRLIAAAEAADNVRPIGLIPANEAQVRPLTRLMPERQREVWQRAVETAPEGKVTARHVEQVCREIQREHSPAARPSAQEREAAHNDRLAREFQALSSQMRLSIDQLRADQWKPLSRETVVKHLKKLLALAEWKPGTKPQAEEI